MIEDTEKFIERFRYKATKAVQVQSKIKQLDKVERLEVDEEDKSAINLRFPPAPRSGTVVVEAEGLSKSYGHLMFLTKLILRYQEEKKLHLSEGTGKVKLPFQRSS